MKIRTKLLLLYLIPFITTGIISFLSIFTSISRELNLIGRVLLQVVPLAAAMALAFFMSNKIISPLKVLTDSAKEISRGDLNQKVNLDTEDEFGELAKTFNQMTESMQKRTKSLADSLVELKEETDRANEATAEVAVSAQYMDCATNESQHIIDHIVKEKDFSIRFANPELPNCWEVKKCNKTDCPAYKNSNKRCWHIAGTFCGGEPCGMFARQYGDCRKCEVYQKATPNRLCQLGECLNHILNLLEVEKKRKLSS